MTKHLYDLFRHWGTNIYCISDPHFGDLESYKLRGLLNVPDDLVFAKEQGDSKPYDLYIEERLNVLDEMQIKNINAKAGKNATLIILGDVGNIECVKKLKAKYKILIMGNHDKGASNYKKEVYHDTKFIDEFPLDFIPEDHGYQVVDPTPVGNLYDKVTTNNLFDEVYEGPLMINDRVILSHEPIFPTISFMFNIHGHVHNKNYRGDEHHLNVCAEAVDYFPINLLKFIKDGSISHIQNIHRVTINDATKRKKSKN